MNMADIIRKKREGGALSAAEIRFWITGYVRGEIPDYQVSALLMAIFFRSLTPEETLCLTMEMRDSGVTVDLSDIEGVKADKHSTGGVGDKTTLIVAPIAAAAGLKVAKMSGRGLSFTGGTLDKLESIPGFTVGLSEQQFKEQVQKIGLALIGQTAELAPADKLLYALRDVTATVDSAPLIASSVMSKKLAVGADALVLDVKYGSGAFMKTPELARQVAEQMVQIGRAANQRVSALLTSMEQPLGLAVGNALEVREALQVLEGQGPEDLRQLSLELAAELLYLGGLADCRKEGLQMAAALLESGAALSKFVEMVQAQGGNGDFSLLPEAPLQAPFTAAESGYIYSMDCEQVGLAAMALGAGRAVKEDAIDHAAGIVFHHKIGERVSAGQTIAVLHCQNETQAAAATEILRRSIKISPFSPAPAALVSEVLV